MTEPKFTSGCYVEALHDIWLWKGKLYSPKGLKVARAKKPKDTEGAWRVYHGGVWYPVEWTRNEGIRVQTWISDNRQGSHYFKTPKDHFKYAYDGEKHNEHVWYRGRLTPRETMVIDGKGFTIGRAYVANHSGPTGCVFVFDSARHDTPDVFFTWKEIEEKFLDFERVKDDLEDMNISMLEVGGLKVTPTVNIYRDGVCGSRPKSADHLLLFEPGKVYTVFGIGYNSKPGGYKEHIVIRLQSENKDESVPRWLSPKQMCYIAPADIFDTGERDRSQDEPDPISDQVGWTHWFMSRNGDIILEDVRRAWVIACAAAVHGESTDTFGMRQFVSRMGRLAERGCPDPRFMGDYFGPFDPRLF